jgi:hypothetical protein
VQHHGVDRSDACGGRAQAFVDVDRALEERIVAVLQHEYCYLPASTFDPPYDGPEASALLS